jgi:hypothetical protein
MEYMKEVVGDVEVPLYDSSKADPSAPINASAAKMKFGDYIDLIQREPTDLRIFLFDPIKYAPKLLEDYISPKELMGGFWINIPICFWRKRICNLPSFRYRYGAYFPYTLQRKKAYSSF